MLKNYIYSRIKKIFYLISILLLILSFSACDWKTSEDNKTAGNSSIVSAHEQKKKTDSKPKKKKNNSRYMIKIDVGEETFSGELYKNKTSKEWFNQLPMTLDMGDLNGNEKYYYFKDKLPTNSKIQSSIKAGDLMLFGSDCLVLFYENFSSSYSYTKLGYIKDVDNLLKVIGNGDVKITFRKG